MGLARSILWLGLLAAASLPVHADTPKAPASLPPDPELLEFLADWQDADGKWIDPMTFADIDPAAVAARDARTRHKPLAPATPPPPADTGKRTG